MTTERAGVYRKYHGKVPTDEHGQPLPRSEWPRKRRFSWAVRWCGSEGTRYSRSFKTRKEADRFAEGMQADLRCGKADVPGPLTLKAFEPMYLGLRGDLASSTLDEHGRALRYLREHFGDDQLIGKITPLRARQFVSWYRQREHRGKTLSAATANKLIRECRRIFREAVDCQLLRYNPFASIAQEKVGEAAWHLVTPDEFHQLLESCPSLRWRGMITLGYCCGLRLGEVLHLTWSDIDFEKGLLRIARKRSGADGPEWTPKDKDMRVLPLPAQAVSVLAELQAAAEDHQVHVFVNGKGPNRGGRVQRQNTWRDFNAIRERAGLPPCSFHHLRKTYCTNMAEALPIHVVQELAGHSQISTTRNHYLKVGPDFLGKARKVVEAFMPD